MVDVWLPATLSETGAPCGVSGMDAIESVARREGLRIS